MSAALNIATLCGFLLTGLPWHTLPEHSEPFELYLDVTEALGCVRHNIEARKFIREIEPHPQVQYSYRC